MESGSEIVLDREIKGKPCSEVEHEATGERTVIHERNGTFQFNVRVPKSSVTGANRAWEVTEKDEREGFQRPGTLEADLFY